MNAIGSNSRLIERLQNKEFRDAYVAGHVRTGIAYQIEALREQRGWSQAELGRRAGGKPQSVISRLESPEYGRLSVQTLLEIAAAFDVALLVRFVPFSELLERTADVSPEALEVPSFAEDRPQAPRATAFGRELAESYKPIRLNDPSRGGVARGVAIAPTGGQAAGTLSYTMTAQAHDPFSSAYHTAQTRQGEGISRWS